MYEILLVILVVVAIGLIGLVMLQQGKGATMGASFGAGASNTVFGSSGAANFMTRTTAVFATLFFIISLALGNLSARTGEVSVGGDSKWDNIGINEGSPAVKEPANIVIPATPKANDSKDSTSDNVDIPR